MEYDFNNKDGLLAKMRNYAEAPDDDTIRIKNRIRNIMLDCPELLYALHWEEYESELFNDDGSLNTDGEWSIYFGNDSAIKPYLIFPTVETDMRSYICYQVGFDENMRYNDNMRCCLITFNIFVYNTDNMDKETGIPRHDLIGSIIRELFAWNGLAMSNAIPISDKEGSTDTNYVIRTMVFQADIPNALVKTTDGITSYHNKGR